MQWFAKTLEVDDFPLPEKTDDIVNIRIIGQTENVVIGEAGFLLCRHILSQIGDHVPSNLHGRSRPGITGGELGVYAGGMIHKICVKASGFDLFLIQISGKLMN